MKRSTVDLVVTGDERAAAAAAADAVRRGQRVLVVLRSDDARVVPRMRRLRRAAKNQLTVMTNAEVVCVDGVGGVEAVVARYTRTGRLSAMNTPAFLSCDGSTHPPRARIGDMPLAVRKIEPEPGEMSERGWNPTSGSRSPGTGGRR
jgi:thioredoxin reductase